MAVSDRARSTHGTIESVIALVLLGSTMMTRGTLAGEDIAFVGSMLILACGLSLVMIGGGKLQLSRAQVMIAGSAVLMWLFLAMHSIANGVRNPYAVSAFFQVSICCVGAAICFSNRKVHDLFFRYFRLFLIVCTISFLITLVLSMAVGLYKLHITNISTSRYQTVYGLYFPVTQSYGVRYNFGVFMPRLGAWFRESGIAQAFFAFAILSVPRLSKPADWAGFVLLVIGGIATQSTTGLAVVGVATAIRLLLLERIPTAVRLILLAFALAISAFAIDFALNDKTIGFASKVDSMSYFDRFVQTQAGLDAFRENPLGYGVYSERVGAGINLLSSLGSIGVFGMAFVLLNCAAAVWYSENRLIKAGCVAAIFFTALTSQPLLDAGLVYIFYGFLGKSLLDSEVGRPRSAPARRPLRP